ncbi:PREDICTED: transmembrane protease serine 12 [Chaetura pelagica]|nr:PREDICTED: transmembrane protease serine 12 [Chaetura pelagica]
MGLINEGGGAGTWSPVNVAKCRASLVDRSSTSQIVGGHPAPRGAWPWTVSLQIRQFAARFTHVCGGVLINENSVLTAAHCIKGRRKPYFWKVVLGVQNLRKPGKYGTTRSIRSVIVHPNFNRQTFDNDIALLELSSAVQYSSNIQPICLGPPDLPPNTHNHTECFISGWGRTSEKGKTTEVLQEAQVEIIPSSVCNHSDAYGGLITKNMICAGSKTGGVDACQGDSGGPLACYQRDTNEHHLIGITSYGQGCGRARFPGIYVRTSQYRGWIESELLLRNKAGRPVSISLPILLTVIPTILVQNF